jgi:ABC-type branched-subunit amino acid transport system ATPase component/ABC-type branched-subunit amino acid transport system permease subunit
VSETATRSPNRLSARRAARPFALAVAAAVVIAFLPGMLGDYYAGVGYTVGINALLALGLILVTGFAGQFSLAQAAFYGIGAYGSALLTVKVGWPAGGALLASAAAATLIAYLLGRQIFRLRGHFLAMGTLALTEIFYLLVNNLSVTGGSSGFGGISFFSIGSLKFDSLRSQFWLIWFVVAAALWAALNIRRGREGRALRALSGHEAAAAACGVHISWSKTRIFAGSAFLGSIAGSLYAHQILYVNPPPFNVMTAVDVLAIVVLGGLRSPWGAVIGAVSFQAIRQGIDNVLPGLFGAGSVGAGEELIFGVILVVILVVRPDGLAGALGALAGFARRRMRRGPAEAVPAAASAAPVNAVVANEADARPGGEVVLAASGLTKHFGGVKAVTEVDLVLHEREILAVIGPNGAGKSTLLNVLSGNLPPTSGTVHLRGKNVTGARADAVAARGLARTFQTPSLFAGMDTRENVLVGTYLSGKVGLIRSAIPTVGAVREERRLGSRADEILADLGVSHLAGTEATHLSLGQQKMVEVGRALAQNPAVLLLDEPGGGLNRVEKLALAETLRMVRRRGVSLVLIEHDMEFVMNLADRVQVIDFGRTLRVGTPAEVQADENVIAAYLGTVHESGAEPETTEAADARP